MSVRTFVFCDVCNRQAIRYVEQRRNAQRSDAQGSRVTDNRAWFEGGIEIAVDQGWIVTKTNKHLCPKCAERRRNNPELFEAWDS